MSIILASNNFKTKPMEYPFPKRTPCKRLKNVKMTTQIAKPRLTLPIKPQQLQELHKKPTDCPTISRII